MRHKVFLRGGTPADAGFTIVEVIVAAMIFAIAVTGVMGAISSLRGPAIASREQVTAAFIGKSVLTDLRSAVDGEGWSGSAYSSGSALSNGVHTLAPVVKDGKTYTPEYLVEDDPGGTMAKKVSLTVTW